MTTLEETLKIHQTQFECVIPHALQHGRAYIFNLTTTNSADFIGIDPQDTQAMIARTQQLLTTHEAPLGIGRYAEKRGIYTFEQYQSRCIHLGIDLSAPVNTAIFAPLAGHIHSFGNHQTPNDYGPTLILKHNLNNLEFYTLYGHLSQQSLNQYHLNQPIRAGQPIATIGDSTINGGWPPHLHFQLIDNIGTYHGDYPGVCSPSETDYWLANCPNPNLILNIDRLKT